MTVDEMAMTVDELLDSPLRPRMCHLVKRPDFQGYGFNLHAEKNKPGNSFLSHRIIDSFPRI